MAKAIQSKLGYPAQGLSSPSVWPRLSSPTAIQWTFLSFVLNTACFLCCKIFQRLQQISQHRLSSLAATQLSCLFLLKRLTSQAFSALASSTFLLFMPFKARRASFKPSVTAAFLGLALRRAVTFFKAIQSTLPQKNRGRTIQSTVPKKTLEKLSSPQFPKKPCRDYPVHTSQKNPAGTIQSTLPKKILEGLSSPQFPKKPWRDYPVHSSQKNPARTIQSTLPKKNLQGLSSPHFPKKKPAGSIQCRVPKKILEGLSSPQFPKKNPDAFSPSAGLRFAKPSLHRSVPGILPAVLVPAVFFLASQPGSLKKRLSSQKLGRLSKAKSQSLPIWLSAHTFSKSPYCYRTSASCSLALSHLSASCCGPQSWSSGIFCRDQSQFWGAALQTSHPLDVRLQKKKVCFQGFPAHFDSKNMLTLRLGLSSPFGLKNQP